MGDAAMPEEAVPEKVDNSNPETRKLIAQLAATLPARVEEIAANAVVLGERLAVEAAGADPETVATIVAEVVGPPDR